MKRTEEAPMQANITGTVAVVYNGATSDELSELRQYLQETEHLKPHILREIECSNCDVTGFYLTEDLYLPTNIDKVQRTLWVLEDVLGNVEIPEWSDYTSNIMEIDVVGEFRIHVGYQHLEDVTLRVLLIEQV